MSSGSVEYELELGVPASEAWDLHGTLRFPLSLLVGGDGVVGTVVKITLAPGTLDLSPHKERSTKVDNEKRIKELEVIEGGPLELGFTMFRVRFEVTEKGEESSIIKSTIEYQLQQEDQVAASSISNAAPAPSHAAALSAPTYTTPTLPAPSTPPSSSSSTDSSWSSTTSTTTPPPPPPPPLPTTTTTTTTTTPTTTTTTTTTTTPPPPPITTTTNNYNYYD